MLDFSIRALGMNALDEILMRVLMACQLYVLQLVIVGWALGGKVFGTIVLSSFFIELRF